MCGIAGIVRFDGLQPEERSLGVRMARTLRHRGPDDLGTYVDTRASLGHARLSIIDLNAGQQPMTNENESIWVVFNGEIYNYRELAQRLIARGHQFKTQSDTEVIVHLYEEYGTSFVDHLNGMFAIALWDMRRRQLLLVRDRIGIKPLYWYHDDQRVLFGSELKAILVDSNVPRSMDNHALTDYLTFGHVPAPRTIYRSIHKLEPGCMVVCSPSTTVTQRYWDIPFDQSGEARSEEAWRDAFEATLEDAVSKRLVADVPVGAFLSGGVDSSVITAAMVRQSNDPVLTHTIGFDERGFDERSAARETAEQLGTDHRELLVQPDAVDASQQLATHFDEPFADSSAIPVFHLSRMTRQRVKVALSGDGADETMAGYRRYRFDLNIARLRSLAPSWLRRSTFGVAGWIYPKADWLPRTFRAKRTLQDLSTDAITAHLRSTSIYGGGLPQQLLRPEYLDDRYDPFERSREMFMRCPSKDLLNRLLYVDTKTLMVDDILTKVDRTSMAVGLEVRVPLLDHRVVELAASMPASLKIGDGQGKRVLRDTLKKWAGESVANRPKHGFDVPVDHWFRTSLAEPARDLLLSHNAHCSTWVDPADINRLFTEHDRGIRHHGHVLWVLWSLEQWARSASITESHESSNHKHEVVTTCIS